MSLTALAWIIVFLSLVALSFKRAAYGLSLYLFTMFMLPQMWWWGDELPDLRWNLLAACVFLVAVVRQQIRDAGPTEGLSPGARRSPEDAAENPLPTGGAPLWLAVIILANATLVHLMSPDLVISGEHYTLLAKFVCLFFLIYLGVKSETDLKIALWTLLLGAAYIGYEVTINDRGNLTGGRLEGVGAAGVQTSNELAALLVTLLPLLGCLFFLSRLYGKLLVIPTIALVVNVLLLCNSRGAFLAGLVSAGVFLVVAPAAARKQACFGLVLGSIAIFALMGDARIFERFMTTFASEEARDGSASGRIDMWLAAVQVIADHPFGSGGNAFPNHYSRAYTAETTGDEEGIEKAVHNGFLSETIDWGIQGFTLQIMLIAIVVQRVRRHLRSQQDYGTGLVGAALIAATAAFLTTAVFGNYLDDEWGFWLCAFMLVFSGSRWEFAPSQTLASEPRRRSVHAVGGGLLDVPEPSGLHRVMTSSVKTTPGS